MTTGGKADHVRKSINKYARMEKEKKISLGLIYIYIYILKQDEKKKKYIKTGWEEEEINETVKVGRIQRIQYQQTDS